MPRPAGSRGNPELQQRFAAGYQAPSRNSAWDGALWPLLVGKSAQMREVYHRIGLYAPWRRNIAGVGESGTGKHLFALELHRRSRRRDEPLVHIHASECDPELIQATLAGHTDDAYTGALRERAGLLVEAQGGTVCLNDIQDLAFGSQSYLLEAIEGKPLRPKGNGRAFVPDVRWIFLSQRPLAELVADKKLKPDLAARMGGTAITLPPLRERLEDLVQLVPHLLGEIVAGEEGDLPLLPVSASTMQALRQYHWPANVRELEDVLSEALIEAGAESAAAIEPHHLPERLRAVASPRRSRGRPPSVSDAQVARTFAETESTRATAGRLGVTTRTVQRVRRRLARPGAGADLA